MNNNEQQESESEFEKRMRLKDECWKTINHYDIDTNTIYSDLKDVWKKYDIETINKVAETIHHVHNLKRIMTYCNDGSEIAQSKINSHMENIKKGYDKPVSPTRFPIEYYYFGGHYNDMPYIVCMVEHCAVKKDDWGFDLLFAVQFSLTPILECREFLTYHLKESFNNNITEFDEYLDNICLEHKEFLAEKHKPFYEKYIEELLPSLNEAEKKITSTHRTKLNWQGQSNSLAYLFRQLKVFTNKKGEPLISNSYEDIALFMRENFTCFEDVEISTIAGMLKKTSKPMKADKKIDLYV
jgi:hypothetical protein